MVNVVTYIHVHRFDRMFEVIRGMPNLLPNLWCDKDAIVCVYKIRILVFLSYDA